MPSRDAWGVSHTEQQATAVSFAMALMYSSTTGDRVGPGMYALWIRPCNHTYMHTHLHIYTGEETDASATAPTTRTRLRGGSDATQGEPADGQGLLFYQKRDASVVCLAALPCVAYGSSAGQPPRRARGCCGCCRLGRDHLTARAATAPLGAIRTGHEVSPGGMDQPGVSCACT